MGFEGALSFRGERDVTRLVCASLSDRLRHHSERDGHYAGLLLEIKSRIRKKKKSKVGVDYFGEYQRPNCSTMTLFNSVMSASPETR